VCSPLSFTPGFTKSRYLLYTRLLAGYTIRGLYCYGCRLVYSIVVVLPESDKLNNIFIHHGLFRLLTTLSLLRICGFLLRVFSGGMI
jgi:hypothetical protein